MGESESAAHLGPAPSLFSLFFWFFIYWKDFPKFLWSVTSCGGFYKCFAIPPKCMQFLLSDVGGMQNFDWSLLLYSDILHILLGELRLISLLCPATSLLLTCMQYRLREVDSSPSPPLTLLLTAHVCNLRRYILSRVSLSSVSIPGRRSGGGGGGDPCCSRSDGLQFSLGMLRRSRFNSYSC